MKYRYIYAFLALAMVFFVASADAQNKSSKKKQAAKTTKTTKPAKSAAKPAAKQPEKKAAEPATTQDTTNKGNALTEEIVVTTAYKPVLADAVKIRINPDLSDKTPFKAPLTYVTLDKRLERNTDIKQLDPMKMPKEVDSVPSNNYARLGLGNFKTTYGEFYVNNGQNESLQIGAFGKHLGQSGTNMNKQNEMTDEVGGFVKGITGDNTFSARIKYNRLGTYFYGFNQADPPGAFSPDAQHFNTVSGEAEVTKNFKGEENELTYAVKLDGYVWNNAYYAHESNLVLTGFLNETVKQFYAGLGASLDLSTQKDSLYSFNNSILRLNPYLKFQGDNYKIDAGLNLAREFGYSGRVFIFPAAKLEYQIIPKYVRIFVEARGDVNKTSLRDFADENPFIGQNISIINSVDKLDVSAGLKGTIIPGLGFKVDVFRNSIKNLPMFISNFNSSGKNNPFTVVYDGGNSRVTGLNGELTYRASDTFDIFGRVEFRNYSLATEAEPWNLPKFKLTMGTAFHVTPKLTINATLLYRGSAFDRTDIRSLTPGGPVFTPTIVTIKGFADLNGGVEYRLNDRFSIFGQVNNILNTTNQVWLYYPNYGFNIFGGVGFHF